MYIWQLIMFLNNWWPTREMVRQVDNASSSRGVHGLVRPWQQSSPKILITHHNVKSIVAELITRSCSIFKMLLSSRLLLMLMAASLADQIYARPDPVRHQVDQGDDNNNEAGRERGSNNVIEWLKRDSDFDELSKDSVDSTTENSDESDNVCIICYSDFSKKERCVLECKHIYHRVCLKRWAKFKRDVRCPLCQGPLKLENGQDLIYEFNPSNLEDAIRIELKKNLGICLGNIYKQRG